MSEKRYFKMEYDEEWYLFDSTIISEQFVKEQVEYGYGVFADSLSPSEIVDLLNGQESIIISLKKRNEQLGRIVKMSEKRFSNLEIVKNLILLDDNDKFTVFTEKTLCNLLNELNDENEQLRQAEKINEEYAEQIVSENKKLRIAKNDLRKENEQLRQRVALYEEQEDEFERYTAQTIQNMIANYRDD